jgi:hypothetical protein
MAQRRLKGARKNFDDGMQAARESRRDVDYIKGKTAYVFFISSNHGSPKFTMCSPCFTR